MGIFNSKPKSVNQTQGIKKLPSLPEFPEFPEIPEEGPAYESTIKDIKQGIDSGEPENYSGSIAQPARFEEVVETNENKPLFIRIDQYKAALAELEKLKQKASEAESLLDEINEVRSQESSKLDAWRRDIGAIKEKLISVDKVLFEV